MRTLIFSFILLAITQISFSQTSYQKVLSVNGASTAAEAMARTSDGGFALAGETNVNGNAESFLSKFDKNGNEVWTRIYFDEQSHLQMSGVNDTEIFCNQFLKYLITTQDGGFVLGGGIDSSVSITYPNSVTSTSDYNRIYCIKTDSSGNFVWANKFGLNELDWSNSAIEESHTGDFVIAGSVNQTGFVSRDNLIMKLDLQGNLLWSKSFGGSFDEGVSSIIEINDGDFVTCGTSESFSNNMDIYAVKMDSSGEVIWSKHYGSTGFDYGKSVMQSNDGGYYFFGNAGAANPSYLCLFKTDSNGVVQWANTYGGYPLDGPQALFKLSDGNFGAMVYHYTSDYNSSIVEIDSDGNYILNRDFGKTGNSSNDFLTALLPDGTANIICGASNSFSGNQFTNQIYVIRTHDDLESDCYTEVLNFSPTALALTEGDATTVPATESIQRYSMKLSQLDSIITIDTLCIALYTSIQNLAMSSGSFEAIPNPASQTVIIQNENAISSEGKLVLTDVEGKIILIQKITETKTPLDVSSLHDGIYFLHLESASGKSTEKKLMVSH